MEKRIPHLIDNDEVVLKRSLSDLAMFGGRPLFGSPKSTSNLLKPDIDKFLDYSKTFYDAKHYSNNGPVARMLERRLADFHGAKHCLVFSSGFWAIALALRCVALPGKTEIIMPSLTYRRMADIAAWIPLKPHFCEIDPTSLAMTPETVEPHINKNTAVILGTHPIVNCCDSQALIDLAAARKIPIIFDSVESTIESLPEGRIGSFGEAECFSLHACKLLNGFGGGYLTSNNDELVRQLSALRTFGFTAEDHIEFPGGLNAKLNEMHAAMTLASLDGLADQIELNRARYYTYKTMLKNFEGIRLLAFDERYQAGFKNIVVELTPEWPLPRALTVNLLNAENVLARAYYSPPLHRRSFGFPHVSNELPITDELAASYLNMPCGQRVSLEDIEHIVGLMHFLKKEALEIKNRLDSHCAVASE